MTLQFLRPVLFLGKLQVPGLDYISFLFFLCPTFGVLFKKLEPQTFAHFSRSTSMNYIRTPRKFDCVGISIKIGYEF